MLYTGDCLCFPLSLAILILIMDYEEEKEEHDPQYMSEKEVERMKESDLSKVRVRAYNPQMTWFFERGDGVIIACEEKEAWDICYNRSNWKRHDFKLLGVSDGTTYAQMVKDSQKFDKELSPQIEKLHKELKRYVRAEERLIVDEAVDMEDTEDPENAKNVLKVKRLRKIMDRLENDIDEKQKEYKDKVKNVVARAQDAELEKARGNIVWPNNANIETPNVPPSERKRILNIMGGRGQAN